MICKLYIILIKTISEKDGRFAEFLRKKGIKQILYKVKHPQSNGKIERWFEAYDRHRGHSRAKKSFCIGIMN